MSSPKPDTEYPMSDTMQGEEIAAPRSTAAPAPADFHPTPDISPRVEEARAVAERDRRMLAQGKRRREEQDQLEYIALDFIMIGEGRRPVNEQAVADLVTSIEQIGLQTPISVRWDDDIVDPETGEETGGYWLVAGRHRLEAGRRLGWDEAFCRVWPDGSDPVQVEMWELSENLHRADLTVQERAEHIARWAALAERKQEEVLPQVVAKPNLIAHDTHPKLS